MRQNKIKKSNFGKLHAGASSSRYNVMRQVFQISNLKRCQVTKPERSDSTRTARKPSGTVDAAVPKAAVSILITTSI